ncbi:MAG: hypothetical protein ACHQCG_09750 [Solirubrobacterales bacterium]
MDGLAGGLSAIAVAALVLLLPGAPAGEKAVAMSLCGAPWTVASHATGTASKTCRGNLSRAGIPRVPTISLLRSSLNPMSPPTTSPKTAGSAPW